LLDFLKMSTNNSIIIRRDKPNVTEE
jgi:hypothetical protein